MSTMRLPVVAWSSALFLALAAHAAAPAPKAVPAEAASACAALHTLPAERRRACCPASGGGDLAALCRSELGAAIGRGTVKVDAEAVEQCHDETETALEGCGWVTPLAPVPPRICTAMIQGTLKAGTSCRSSLECEDGLHCQGVTANAPGVCRTPLAAHERCEFPADNLATYARGQDDPRHPVCAGTCLKNQCIDRARAGEACSATAACVSGLTCQSGHCSGKPLPALGESCSAQIECAGDAVCVDGTCAGRKDAGQACKLPFECRSLECARKEGADTGVCTDACAAL